MKGDINKSSLNESQKRFIFENNGHFGHVNCLKKIQIVH